MNRRKGFKRESMIQQSIGRYLKVIFKTGNIGISTEALSRCSTSWAPWYVITADLKWFRNWAVAQIIVNRLDKMKLKFPEPEIDVSSLIIK